jgi:hypothetical protein
MGAFGVDPRWGRDLLRWVGTDYERVARFGREPFRGAGFGVVLLRRKQEGAAQAPLRQTDASLKGLE